MQTRHKQTVVVIPNDDKVEVSYFCTDNKLKEKEKEKYIELIIQLHDCHFAKKILKTTLENPKEVEALVQRTVINSKGHLCY